MGCLFFWHIWTCETSGNCLLSTAASPFFLWWAGVLCVFFFIFTHTTFFVTCNEISVAGNRLRAEWRETKILIMGVTMVVANKENRHKKWKDRQLAKGKKPISVMVNSYVKDLIDREKKRRGVTIANVIETAVISFLDDSVNSDNERFPAEDFKQIADDLQGIVHRIEKITGIKAAASDQLVMTKENFEEVVLNHPTGKTIIRIVGMFFGRGAHPATVAKALNMHGDKTFRGDDEWTENDVEEIYKLLGQTGLHIGL